MGRSITVDLIGRSAGTTTAVTGRRGTRVPVDVPADLERDDGDVADFEF